MAERRDSRRHPGPDPAPTRLRPPGSRKSAWRLGGILGLSAVVFLLGCASFLSRWSSQHAEGGIQWADAAGGVVVSRIEPGGPGHAAGILEGDRLQAIGEDAAGSALEAADLLWRAEPGRALPLTLERGGVRRVVALMPVEVRDDMHLYAYLAMVGVLALVLGTVLSLRLPPGRAGLSYYLLSLMSFLLLALSHSGTGGLLDWIVYWGDTGARAFLPSAFLHFVLTFARPGRPRLPRAATAGLYLPGLAALALEVVLLAGGGAYRFALPLQALERAHRLQTGWVAFGLSAGILLLAVAYARSVGDRARRPLKWLLWGAAAGLGPFLALYMVPSVLGVRLPGWTELSVLPLVLAPLCFASAVARYRLTDLELFFKRGLATAAVVGCAGAGYLAMLLLARRLLPEAPRGLPQVLGLLVALAALPWLRARIGQAVDRIFYQEHYDHRRSLQEFGRDLGRLRQPEPLARKLADRLSRTLGIQKVAVLVSEPEAGVCRLVHSTEELLPEPVLSLDSSLARALARGPALDLQDPGDPRAEEEASAPFEEASLRYLVPLQVGDSLAGLLTLGDRRAGGPLNSEDRELLEAVARHAAVALEGARVFDELQRRMAEVESLKEFSEGILESSRVGVLVIREDRRIAGCNRALADLAGLSREETADRSLEEVFGAPFAAVLREGIAAPAAAGRRFREHLQTPLGRRQVNLAFSPLHQPGGRRSWVVTFDDITEGIRREEVLIQQERLASIGLLASGVAHEVNTPLTGISSYAQLLLQETAPTDPRYELLRKIEQQSFRASDIANRLLNFSRPDHHGFEELQADLVVEDTLLLFEPQLRGRRVFVRREHGEGLPAIRGHRGKLQQVLLNLLMNARDAMPDGGEIHMRTSVEDGNVIFEVRDTGEGIRSELLGRIYDPFFTTKSPGRGTGLGLSIAYGIVQEHSGRIDVESSRESGTRFLVRLPGIATERAAARA